MCDPFGVLNAIPTGDEEVVSKFPLRRYYTNNFRNLFKNLKKYTPSYSSSPFYIKALPENFNYRCDFRDKFLSIQNFQEDYWKINIIVDYFTEEARMKCRYGDEISPEEYFQRNLKGLVSSLVRKGLPVNGVNLREELYLTGPRECFRMKATVMYSLYYYFFPDKVLDPFSGWGGSLLAAMAIPVSEYWGYEVNPDLKKPYEEINDKLGGKETIVKLFWEPFENSSPPTEYFDFCFACPPFFDLEKYQGEQQSILLYPKIEDWIEWLLRSFKIIYRSMRKTGVLAVFLYLNHHVIITRLFEFLSKLMKYEGCIGVRTKFKNQVQNHLPLWIWKK